MNHQNPNCEVLLVESEVWCLGQTQTYPAETEWHLCFFVFPDHPPLFCLQRGKGHMMQ